MASRKLVTRSSINARIDSLLKERVIPQHLSFFHLNEIANNQHVFTQLDCEHSAVLCGIGPTAFWVQNRPVASS